MLGIVHQTYHDMDMQPDHKLLIFISCFALNALYTFKTPTTIQQLNIQSCLVLITKIWQKHATTSFGVADSIQFLSITHF